MGEVFSGFVSLLDGMSGGINPAIIPDTTYARGINVSSRGGMIHTRPGFAFSQTLGPGVFRGAGRWSLNAGDRIAVLLSGRLIVVDAETDTVLFNQIVFPEGGTSQAFFEQAGAFLVVQDGADAPVVLQEVSGVISVVLATEISLPPGYVMRYVHGRLHMVPVSVGSEDGRPYFISGDILLPDDAKNVLKATETSYWNEGGAHGLPAEMGFIRGMATMRNSATGTGAGALLVFGVRGVSGFDMSIERQFWKETALSQVLFFDAGTDSPWSTVSVNNDVAYRGLDGLRFVKYTGSALAGAALSNVPQSNEVTTFMDLDTAADLPWVSASLGDNRLLVTTAGRDGVGFRGLVSLDFAQVHGFRGTQTPAYDGLYTGFSFCQVVSALRDGVLTTFAVTSDGTTHVLRRLDAAARVDTRADGTTSPIAAQLVTKVMAFEGLDLKKLEYAEFWVSDVEADTVLELFFRPSGYPLWAPAETTRVLPLPAGCPRQIRRRIRIPMGGLDSVASPVTGEPLNLAHEFQFAIRFTGWAQFDKFRVVARTENEGTPPPCNDVADAMLTGVSFGEALNDFDYKVE